MSDSFHSHLRTSRLSTSTFRGQQHAPRLPSPGEPRAAPRSPCPRLTLNVISFNCQTCPEVLTSTGEVLFLTRRTFTFSQVLLLEVPSSCLHPGCQGQHLCQVRVPAHSARGGAPTGGSLRGKWECLERQRTATQERPLFLLIDGCFF